MFNNLILSILLSLHFSACSTNTSEASADLVEVPAETEVIATTVQEEATPEMPVTEVTPEPTVETPKEKTVLKKETETVKAPQAPARQTPSPAKPVTIEKPSTTAPVVVEEPIPSPAPVVAEEKVAEAKVAVEEPKVLPKPPAPAKPNHSNWNSLLVKYVNSKGDVNYAGFKADKAKLQAYLDELSNNPPASSWSRNEKIAFWINAYNAYTVKLIVDNYPVKSITNLKGGKPWDVKWIKIGAKTYSLNNIEHDILRPQYKDARIHFAVNCAAESCPPLLNKAWTTSNVNSYFEKQAKTFINNTAYNKITANKVQVSKIFDWYKEDFGTLIDYLNKYSNTKINANAKVEFLEYNWALNKQ